MTNEQRLVILECVGRRAAYPPGALAWVALRKVLIELLTEEMPPVEPRHESDTRYSLGN